MTNLSFVYIKEERKMKVDQIFLHYVRSVLNYFFFLCCVFLVLELVGFVKKIMRFGLLGQFGDVKKNKWCDVSPK